MNVELLEKIADWLEAGAPHIDLKNGKVITDFNMSVGVRVKRNSESECQTACCIAGAAVLVSDNHNEMLDRYINEMNLNDYVVDEMSWPTIKQRATEMLGLTDDQASMLFTPYDMAYRSSSEAAEVIRHFIATGEIAWSDLGELNPDNQAD